MTEIPKRRAKIIGTLGPASSTIEQIQELIETGLDVIRINMSHGLHKDHAEVIKNVRKASKLANKEVGVFADLQGPKIRVDLIDKPLELKQDEEWYIGPTSLQDKYPQYTNYIPTTYKNLVKDCSVGERVLFDDGLLRAIIIEEVDDLLKIKIEVGGMLKANKGINLPDTIVSAPSFTDKDEKDFYFALEQDIDFIALSFVRKKEDINKVKFLLHKMKKRIPIIAKVENPEAIDNLYEIIQAADIVMVARGDMGVELGNHLVPAIQKKIIRWCNEVGKPVITATQMLETMITNFTPTRAEASDVANAVWDGTDLVMLSGETAVGKYPVDVVRTMDEIILEAEKTPKERGHLRDLALPDIQDTVMLTASVSAEKVDAKLIVSVTKSGNSCIKLSRFRPVRPIIGMTNNEKALRKMSILWGVVPYRVELDAEKDTERSLINKVRDEYDLQNGDKIVVTTGVGNLFKSGMANSMKVELITRKVSKEDREKAMDECHFDDGSLYYNHLKCIACQSCVYICPHDIWETNHADNRRVIMVKENAPNCTVDFECVRVCPTGAIQLVSNIDDE